MRICVSGNSHVAALKEGWDLVRDDYPDIEITFFGAPADTIRDLEVGEGVLRPRGARLAKMLETTAGQSEIRPEYDRYVVYGYNQGVYPPLDARLSEAVVDIVLRERFEASLGTDLARKLRAISPNRTMIARMPLKMVREPGEAGATGEVIAPAQIDERLRELAGQAGFEWFSQPPETLSEDGLSTLPEYSTSSARLSSARTEEGSDAVHKNADYGRIVIREVIAALAGR